MSQELFEVGEIAPHSQQAEEAVLGPVLINPDAFLEVNGFLTSEDFFILRNGWIFEAMERLHHRGDQISFLSVCEELRHQNRLDDIGGSAYVNYLASNTATSVHIETFGRIVERAAIRRRMLEAAGEITQLAREEDADINEVVDRAEGTFYEAISQHRKAKQRPFAHYLDEALDRVENNQENQLQGIPLFLADLRTFFGEMPRGWFIILAAKEGTGKSRFAIQWTLYMLMQGRRVLFFCVEVDPVEIIWTIISMMSALDKGLYLPFTMMQKREVHNDPKTSERYIVLMDQLSRFNFEPIDATEMNARDVYNIACKTNADMTVVDYLQDLDPMPGKWNGDYSEVGERVRLLRKAAKKSNSLMLCVSQFNRDGNKASDPGTEHLAESDKIGKAAQVAFSIVEKKGLLTIKCIKDRYLGIKGKYVKMMLHPTYGTFQQVAPSEQMPSGRQVEINLEDF